MMDVDRLKKVYAFQNTCEAKHGAPMVAEVEGLGLIPAIVPFMGMKVERDGEVFIILSFEKLWTTDTEPATCEVVSERPGKREWVTLTPEWHLYAPARAAA